VYPHPAMTTAARPILPVRAPGLVAWVLGAAALGAAVAGALGVLVAAGTGEPFDPWFVWQGVLFAEIVGLTAFVGSRWAFPLLADFHPLARQALQVLTFVGAAFAATAIAVVLRPGVVFARPLQFLALVGANVVLSLVFGGGLAAWETMRWSLEQAFEELREKEVLEREMALAREVQQGLLPEGPPEVPGLEIAFSFVPARSVGGDFVGFVPLSGGRLGIAVADVTGKGIAAALLGANFQAMLEALAPRVERPGELLAELSRMVDARTGPARFVTLAWVILDPATGRISWSLAGHPPPLVHGADGTRWLAEGGVPLGVLPGLPYAEGSGTIDRGDVLVLYTDGLMEAPARGDPDDQFGRDRLARLVAGCRGCDAREVLERILAALAEHEGGGPPADDTTVVVVRRVSGGEGDR